METICWKDEYSINIKEMDNHHRQLFKNANKLYEAILNNEERPVLKEVLNLIVDYSEYHFAIDLRPRISDNSCLNALNG